MQNGLYQNFAKFYDKIYQSKNNDKETDFIAFVLKKYGNKGKNVMDMACGTGEQVLRLSKKGFNVIGVDLNEGMLGVAKSKSKKIKFLKGNMRTYRAHKKLDAITCLFSSINHNKNLKELRQTIENFHKNLNAGGICLFDLGFVNKKTDKHSNGCTLETITDNRSQIARISQWAISPRDESTYETQDLIFVKANGKVDFEIDRHELGLFEVKDVKNIMEKTGFRVLIFETWTDKKYSGKTRRPIFVGIKP